MPTRHKAYGKLHQNVQVCIFPGAKGSSILLPLSTTPKIFLERGVAQLSLNVLQLYLSRCFPLILRKLANCTNPCTSRNESPKQTKTDDSPKEEKASGVLRSHSAATCLGLGSRPSLSSPPTTSPTSTASPSSHPRRLIMAQIQSEIRNQNPSSTDHI